MRYHYHTKHEDGFTVVIRKDDYTDPDYESDNDLEIGKYEVNSCARMVVDALYSAQRVGNI